MKRIEKKDILYTLALVAVGLVINRIGADAAVALGIPLYMDCIGTIFTAVLGGTCPGMVVGFITNMIGGLSDSSTFYYGTINVLIALIAGAGGKRGAFRKYTGTLALIPYFMLLSVPCSFLSYILFEFQVADNVAAPAVSFIHSAGVPVLLSQIIGDYVVEIPDKLLSLTGAFLLLKLVPARIFERFDAVAGRGVKADDGARSGRTKLSLRTEVSLLLLLSGLAIAAVAFAISYKTYHEARVQHYEESIEAETQLPVSTAEYERAMQAIRIETLLYCSKMFSAVLGLLLCIVSFAIVLSNQRFVGPLQEITDKMRHFVYDTESGRDDSVAELRALNISTGNEIEQLYDAICKTVGEIDSYIDMTGRQAQEISRLHINIITTLADLVESRDATTGYHVRRTAAYSTLIAEELQREGKYPEIVTDEYIQTISIAAPLHDIGKIRISDVILNKPARLNEAEFEQIKLHTTLGREMLENASEHLGATGYLQMAKDIAAYHHEWWDGGDRGYPEHLKGEEIPLSARIMAVADVFDALVSKRPYKEGYPVERALDIIISERGTHFDPQIVDAFLKITDHVDEVIRMYRDK